MQTAYLALGSNLGDRRENLNRAVAAVAALPDTRVAAVSGIYETRPVGYAGQPDFYNAAVRLETGLSPRALLGACLGIEAAMGRVRELKNGPRLIDLDLLLYGKMRSGDPELSLPHPRMEERAFVLAPLAEICEEPRYRTLLEDLDTSGVRLSEAKITPPEK